MSVFLTITLTLLTGCLLMGALNYLLDEWAIARAKRRADEEEWKKYQEEMKNIRYELLRDVENRERFERESG